MKNKIVDSLKNATKIGILSHKFPDGDTLGSQIALARALTSMGKEVVCYNIHQTPETFTFLKESGDIMLLSEDYNDWPDVLVAVDCGSLERIGLKNIPSVREFINIDHHAGNTMFGSLNWVDDTAPATCQMIADLLCSDEVFTIDSDIATALMTGLSTDTGSFKYDKTSVHTFEIAAYLKSLGADTDLIRYHIYENMSKGHFMIMQYLFANTVFLNDGQIAYTSIDYATSEKLSPDETGFSGIIAQIKEIEKVELAILFRETKDSHIKISLRSKSFFDVNAFALPYGGGGHHRAAGIIMDKTLEDVKNDLLEEIVTVFKQQKDGIK